MIKFKYLNLFNDNWVVYVFLCKSIIWFGLVIGSLTVLPIMVLLILFGIFRLWFWFSYHNKSIFNQLTNFLSSKLSSFWLGITWITLRLMIFWFLIFVLWFIATLLVVIFIIIVMAATISINSSSFSTLMIFTRTFVVLSSILSLVFWIFVLVLGIRLCWSI